MKGVDSSGLAKPPIGPTNRTFALAFFAILLLSVPTMMFSKLLPTPLGIQVSQAAGALAGLCTAWAARNGGIYSPANPTFSVERRGGWLLKHVWLRVPLMGLFAYFITFSFVEGGVIALFTAATGQPSSRTVTITGTGGGGRSCRRFEIREMTLLASSALCAPDDELAQAANGRTLTVFGKASSFGLNVERRELGPPPEAQP